MLAPVDLLESSLELIHAFAALVFEKGPDNGIVLMSDQVSLHGEVSVS